MIYEKYSQENTKILLESIWYDMLSGEFYWLNDRPLYHFKNQKGRSIWSGKDAGTKITGVHRTNKKTPYPRVKVNGQLYLLHLVAWRILYGEWPAEEIDHIDRNGANNTPVNLRLADDFKQNQNKDIYKTNKIGIAGVYNYPDRPAMYIVKYGKKYLGNTYDFFEACCIRKTEEIKYIIKP